MERLVALARADDHAAIRRLHLAGAPIREVAQVLGISHQRVQQIVGSAGGSCWRRAWRSRRVTRDLACSGCGRPDSAVEKLIAGPDVFMCDACVVMAERAASELDGARPAPGEAGPRCSFCGNGPRQGRLVRAGGRITICGRCLTTCRDILDAGGDRV